MNPAAEISLAQVAGALALVAIAVAVSRWRRAELEQDIGIAVFRSFVQLTAMGYVIQLILDEDNLLFVTALLATMVLFGAYTARSRAHGVPGAFGPLIVALGGAAFITLGLVLVLDVFDASSRALVPVGGMVIGNAMTAAAVALNRLADEFRSSRADIEAALALGATAREAAGPVARRSLRSGLIPLVDSTKTTGLIFFPGTMVGMLLAGADAVDAVRLQMILLWVLLGAVATSALVAVTLAYRRFFTRDHQLRDLPTP